MNWWRAGRCEEEDKVGTDSDMCTWVGPSINISPRSLQLATSERRPTRTIARRDPPGEGKHFPLEMLLAGL
jgi:hypothetical protein